MTAILGVLDAGASVPGERAFHAALVAGSGNASSSARLHLQPGAALGITGSSRKREGADECAGFAIDHDYIVLVDGTFYYVEELRRKLGVPFSMPASKSQLVLKAFRTFGYECVTHLEGDYAFLVWNRSTREVFCARDFSGRRGLFLAEWCGGLAVASSLDSLAALPGFNPRLNPGAVGADAAGLFLALDDETCVEGVRTLRSGHSCSWRPGRALRSVRTWFPTPDSTSTLSFDDAARALRDLIARAAAERLSERGPTVVWLSGGRDSSAVFAAAKLATESTNRRVLYAVSRSHPPGDSGREDEAIEEICRFCNTTPNWVDARKIPLFETMRNRDRWSSESFSQPFEGLAHALAKASRTLGCDVALDGYGGDFLFQVSHVYIADLMSENGIRRGLKEWRALGARRNRLSGFYRYGIQPLLPRWARQARPRVLFRGSMERQTPPWINPAFERQHSLADRFPLLGPEGQSGLSAVDREAQFYLTHQFFARVNARMYRFGMEHGVELRSPLLDARVVRFALSRPAEERNQRGDTKRLLRASMHELLPASVLAPRRVKTGTLASYFDQHMRSEGLRRLTEMLPARELDALGIVNSRKLTTAVENYRSLGSRYPYAESLFCTLQAETWLRARCAVTTESGSTRSTIGSA